MKLVLDKLAVNFGVEVKSSAQFSSSGKQNTPMKKREHLNAQRSALKRTFCSPTAEALPVAGAPPAIGRTTRRF